MKDRLSRRGFFGVVVQAAVAGIVGAELSMPARGIALQAAEELGIPTTGRRPRTDEIQLGQVQPRSCPDPKNDFFQQCPKPRDVSMDKVSSAFSILTREELPARFVPSLIVSWRDKRPNPLLDTLAGTGETGMSRREITFLIFGSILFGLVHNVGPNGEINTKTLPASEIVGGMSYWLLQRKFGVLANSISHIWFNYRQGAYR